MNFIFDLGNILIEWNKDKILASVVSPEDIDLFDRAIFQSGLWERLDKGDISIEELENNLNKILGEKHAESIHEILWHWPRYVSVFPELYEMIAELKIQGHSIYILSNTSELFYRILEEQLVAVQPLLDGFVISCEVGCMKPDYLIYELLVHKYQLDKKECVFFDDIYENVRAAIDVGLKGYHIKNVEELKDKLRDLV